MIHKKTTINQTSAFILAAAAALKARNPYKTKGAKVLAGVEPLLRRGVSMKLKDEEIAICIRSIPNSPLKGLTLKSGVQYVSQARLARLEFGLRKYKLS